MSIRFVDLFSGIGGFHQAVKRVDKNAVCIFAADNDIQASQVYKNSYQIEAYRDLTNNETHEELAKVLDNLEGDNKIDLLCAGFPCQSFSKAGKQLGFKDETKGTLFFEIEKILNRHKPKYFILENVRNLKNHDKGNTIKTIYKHLEVDYFVDDIIIGPSDLNIPALRERVFILGVRRDLINDQFFLNEYVTKSNDEPSIYNNGTLDSRYFLSESEGYEVPKPLVDILDMWDDFRKRIISNKGKMISPIWTEFFDRDINLNEYPIWKQNIIKKNQEFYLTNQHIYHKWLRNYSQLWNKLTNSNKKFEWNANGSIDSIHKGIVQFRPSGIRVKKPTTIPTLVAINHRPILNRRYLSPQEIGKLYGFDMNILKLDVHNDQQSYKQLGNTVSVDIVVYLLKILFTITGELKNNEI